jgi:BMFP domain-containing protein YqiC
MDRKRIIQDLGQFLGSMLGDGGMIRTELRQQTKQRAELLAKRLDLVTQAEFTPIRAMLVAQREQQQEILARLTRVETALGIKVKLKVKKSKRSTNINPTGNTKMSPKRVRKTPR